MPVLHFFTTFAVDFTTIKDKMTTLNSKTALMVLAVTAMLMACGGGRHGRQQADEAVADSIAMERTLQETQAESSQADTMTGSVHTHRPMFGLTGEVKSVKWYEGKAEGKPRFAVYFAPDGWVNQIGEYNRERDCIYDDDGQVVDNREVAPTRYDRHNRILWLGENGGCSGEMGYHFAYDEAGRISEYYYDAGECTGTVSYTLTYDSPEAQWPAEVRWEWSDIGYHGEGTIRFRYTEKDSQGNWTRAHADIESADTETDEETGKENTTREKRSAIVTRVVEYY